MTGFEVVAGGAGGQLQPLHTLRPGGGASQPRLVLIGQLVAPREAAHTPADSVAVATAPLVDWVVERSTGGQPPTLWAVTPHAWYKLLEPSQRYAPLFEAALQAASAQMEVRWW